MLTWTSGQYDTAVTEFKKAINIDPIFLNCSLGRAYLGQGNLEAAENSDRLENNYYLPAGAFERQAHCDRGDAYLSQVEGSRKCSQRLA